MDYVEVAFRVHPAHPGRDLLADALGEIGFESFVEEGEEHLLAYILASDFDEDRLNKLDFLQEAWLETSWSHKIIAGQNWNAAWESQFEPIAIDTRCRVRASFHPNDGAFDHDLVVDPKMAFGTGHHATTFQMLEQLLELDVDGKTVLDMGCGTGVLAILAAQRGATEVVAIDIDAWAYENTLENVARNLNRELVVLQGDVGHLGKRSFNVILANINKNVILSDLSSYAQHLAPNGDLLMSGFYEEDAQDLIQLAGPLGLQVVRQGVRNRWALLHLKKN
ncbi:MAG: 50S ribosomal protein L11 methyltransferase [Salibacteraceae bacterium]|mgnify:CR=1 FL=1